MQYRFMGILYPHGENPGLIFTGISGRFVDKNRSVVADFPDGIERLGETFLGGLMILIGLLTTLVSSFGLSVAQNSVIDIDT